MSLPTVAELLERAEQASRSSSEMAEDALRRVIPVLEDIAKGGTGEYNPLAALQAADLLARLSRPYP